MLGKSLRQPYGGEFLRFDMSVNSDVLQLRNNELCSIGCIRAGWHSEGDIDIVDAGFVKQLPSTIRIVGVLGGMV